MKVSRRNRRPLLTVVGALHGTGASLLAAMLTHVRQTEDAPIQIDLARVDSVDADGVVPLLDGRVTIRRAAPVVQRLLAALDRPIP